MSKLKKTVFEAGLLLFLILPMVSAQAAMVDTGDILEESTRTQLQNSLKRGEVRQQLIEMGVDPALALSRVENMSNEEIAQLNGQIASLPAGGRLSTVELLLIIIIIILLI